MTNKMLEQVKQALVGLEAEAFKAANDGSGMNWSSGRHTGQAEAYRRALNLIRKAEDREASANYAQWLVGR